MPEPISFPDNQDYREIGDALDFLGDEITLTEFCKQYGLKTPPKYKLRPASREEAGLFYSQVEEERDLQAGTVGHVRMDFGSSGKGFHHSWWPHNEDQFNTGEFKDDLQEVVDTLRADGPLKDLASMRAYLTGIRTLHAEDISFAEDIIQNDNLLEFYMEVSFHADEVFGTNVCTTENDDWLNIYANYDLDARRVCDTLEVYLQRGNGDEEAFKYRLSAEEQALLLPRMNTYCQEYWGQSLEECSANYLSEQSPASPEMQM